MRMAASWMGSMPQKRLQRNPSTISPMRTVRKWSFMNQEEGPRQTLELQGPWSWTSQPPEMWDIIICCLGCPVCSNLNSDMTGLICRYKRGLLFLIWYFFLPHKATASHSHSMHPGAGRCLHQPSWASPSHIGTDGRFSLNHNSVISWPFLKV